MLVPAVLLGRKIAVPIVWRRHDAQPEGKRVLVTDQHDTLIEAVEVPVLDQHHGVVTFVPRRLANDSASRTFYVYWLPYTQSGIGAGLRFAWDPPTGAGMAALGTFEPVLGSAAGQQFKLSVPYAGTRFQWQCSKTGGGFQPFLLELRFKSSTAGWLPNTATAARPVPVAGSSGGQPSGPPNDCGAPWMAMDGNVSTWWDATLRDAWLDITFDSEHTITDVEVFNYGDHTHDCGEFAILAHRGRSGTGSNSSVDWKSAQPSTSI